MKLPRTAADQWHYLQNAGRAIDKNMVQEGDLIYATTDGTFNNPGHTAMMISSTHLIQASQPGVPIGITAYNPSEWSHAARPTGSISGSTKLGNNKSSTSSAAGAANAPSGVGLAVGSYGSSDELGNIGSALLSMAAGGMVPSSSSGTSSSSPNSGKLTNVGPGRSGWARALLSLVGAPQTKANIDGIIAWEIAEGGGFGNQASYNPLNLNPGPGANWPGHNASGAWAFPNAQSGLAETATYLRMSNFSGILSALRSGRSEHSLLEAIVNSPWAGSHYSGNQEMMTALSRSAGGHNWYADGTKNAKPGWAILGERGPEAVLFSGGEAVIPTAQTAGIKGVQDVTWSMGSAAVDNAHPAPVKIEIHKVVLGDNVDAQAAAVTGVTFARGIEEALQSKSVIDKIAQGKKKR